MGLASMRAQSERSQAPFLASTDVVPAGQNEASVGAVEMKTGKLRTILKIIRVILHGATRGRWYLPAVAEITVDDLHDRMNSIPPPLLIDLRSAEEFNGWYGHIPDARWIPMLELGSRLEDLQSFKEREIVTICPGGGMSLAAAEILTEAGFGDVKSLTGGIDLWYKRGYPTTRPDNHAR